MPSCLINSDVRLMSYQGIVQPNCTRDCHVICRNSAEPHETLVVNHGFAVQVAPTLCHAAY